MSTAWKYRPSVWEIKSKDIEIKDENGYVIGGMKRELLPKMSFAPIFTQAAFGAESHLQYDFWNEKNSISIHIDAPLKNIGFVRTVDYRTKDKSLQLEVTIDIDSRTMLGFESYKFEYNGQLYQVHQKVFGESQIILGDKVIATWKREKTVKGNVNYTFEEEYKEDAWLWLAVFHSCYGNDRRSFFTSFLPF